MRKQLLSFLILVICLAAGSAIPAGAADDGDAGLAGAFLNYGVGARGLGMGRAFAGIADDATAVYWNPGGLPLVHQNQAILQYGRLIDGNGYQYLGYDHIFPYIGTLGLGMVYFSQGTAEETNTYGDVTGDFSNSQLGFLLGFGTDVTPELAAGATVKIVNQAMASKSATGLGLDLGLMYRPFTFLNIGLAFQNLVAPAIKMVEVEERYPMNMVIGLGLKLFDNHFKADLDLAKNMEQSALKPRFGVEVMPVQDLFLRGGLDDTEIAVGAGYRWMGFQLDYALGLQTLELMHKVSLSYYFGGFVLDVKADPASFSPVGINKVTVIRINSQTKFQIKAWSLDIVNEANASVKKYSGEGQPPDHIVWDGLMDNTNPMPDGKYTITLIVEDTTGSKNKTEAFVKIQSLLPLGVSPIELN